MRYQFMQEERRLFPIGKMAEVLKVSVSGYYAYLRRPPSVREGTNKSMVSSIKKIYQEGRSMYGSPRIHAKLRERGIICSRKTVAKLMNKHGIAAKMRKSWKRTTKQGTREASSNLLEQDFRAEAPNEKWASDITYIPTGEGWLYVSCTIDLFSRKVVGLSMGNRLTTDLVEKTLSQAVWQRTPDRGIIHHSDRGCQYTSASFGGLAQKYGIVLSMSDKGNCYDNAVMESFFHTLKTEHVHLRRFRTRDEAKSSIFEYIEVFYNRKRAVV